MSASRVTNHSDLAALFGYEKKRSNQPLIEALLELVAGDHPEAVRKKADRLLRKHAPWVTGLEIPSAKLIEAAGTGRDQTLFLEWSLNPERVTFEELAEREGICRQSAINAVRRAETRVRGALAEAPDPLPWAVRSVSKSIGTVTTQDRLDATLSRLSVTGAIPARLIAWLAGPYLPVPGRPGWLALQPRQVVARTSTCLRADGGIRRLVDVELELAQTGIRSAPLLEWLTANRATTILDLAVSVEGPLVVAVERILDAYGEARTIPELKRDLVAGGRPVEAEVLERVLRNRRFGRAATGALVLRDWGDKPRASPRESKPLRRPSPAGARRQKPKSSPKTQEAMWLWVRVDADVLRGSDAAVPLALVEGLGLAPLSRRTFSSRWGPVTLGYDGAAPTRSSVRAIAMAAGARPDDTLLLGFSGTGNVDVQVRRGPGQIKPEEFGSTAAVFFPELFPETVNGGIQ